MAVAAVATVEGPAPDLLGTIALRRPNILVGTTGVAGAFSEAVVGAMDERLGPTERPIVLPLSNPTANCEATPADVLAWTGGRALVATGSPFPPVASGGHVHEIGQANNAFVFPGVGLGAIVAEATTVTDRMFLLAARVLAEAFRVLRPGGTFIALEASSIRSAGMQQLYLIYMRLCMPLIGWIATARPWSSRSNVPISRSPATVK